MIDLGTQSSNSDRGTRLEAKILRLRRDALDRHSNHKQFDCHESISLSGKTSPQIEELVQDSSEQLQCSRSPEFPRQCDHARVCQQVRRGFRKPKDRSVHLRPLKYHGNHRSASTHPHMSSVCKPNVAQRRASSTGATQPPMLVEHHAPMPHLRLPVLSLRSDGSSVQSFREAQAARFVPENVSRSENIELDVTPGAHNAVVFHEALRMVQAEWCAAKARQTESVADVIALPALEHFQPTPPVQPKSKGSSTFRRKHAQVPVLSKTTDSMEAPPPQSTALTPLGSCAEGLSIRFSLDVQNGTQVTSIASLVELSVPSEIKDKSDDHCQAQEFTTVLQQLKHNLALGLVAQARKGKLHSTLRSVSLSKEDASVSTTHPLSEVREPSIFSLEQLWVESPLGNQHSDVVSPVFDIEGTSDEEGDLEEVIKSTYHQAVLQVQKTDVLGSLKQVLARQLVLNAQNGNLHCALREASHDAYPETVDGLSCRSRVDPGESLDLGPLEESMEGLCDSDEESEEEV